MLGCGERGDARDQWTDEGEGTQGDEGVGALEHEELGGQEVVSEEVELVGGHGRGGGGHGRQ